jgi:hypothetical protein
MMNQLIIIIQIQERKDYRNFMESFPIKLGYSLGREISSKLDEESFEKLVKKLKIMVDYIFIRDNFRVLPYGRENADFLRFEERRSKRAGTGFFSYRRMFGYLGLSRNENPNLKDKSSREGLINNAPYRAFESDLKAFFIELAQEYFGDKAKQSIFLDKKNQLKEQSEAIKADKKRETAEKIQFSKDLNTYSDRFESIKMNIKIYSIN